MEEFLSILFVVFFVIWIVINGISWIANKIGEAFSLTIDFIVANWEMHAVAMFFVIVIAVLYVISDEEKKEERKRTDQKKKHKQASPPKPYEPRPEKFTLQYYGAKKSMSKSEICKILQKVFIKYKNKQTSTSIKVQDEAQKHKLVIMNLKTINKCHA